MLKATALNSEDVSAAENFNHFSSEIVHDFQPCAGRKFIYIRIKKIILKINILYHHFSVEKVGFIHVDIYCIVVTG